MPNVYWKTEIPCVWLRINQFSSHGWLCFKSQYGNNNVFNRQRASEVSSEALNKNVTAPICHATVISL